MKGEATGPGLHLLLVEDDDGDAFLVEELLSDTDEPFIITRARSAVEAVGMAGQADCALVDLGLPDAIGLDILTALRAAAPRLAVVVLTGLADRARGTAAVAGGAQDYLVKGEIDGPSLSKAIHYAVERRRADAAEQQLLLAERREAENNRLSRGLLPLLRIDHPGLDVATRYRPGASALLGGDFFDAVMLDGGVVRIVIGDVCGHGPTEAALGVALRIAWRTMVISGATPATTVSSVDAMLRLERDDPTLFATLCDITLDAAAGRMEVRRHGHPPPLVVGSEVRWLEPGRPAPPLGCVPHRDAGVERIDLAPGDSVLLLTDGIYEGRDAGDRLGMDGFADIVATANGRGLTGGALLEELLLETAARHGGDLDDDVALLWLGRPCPR